MTCGVGCRLHLQAGEQLAAGDCDGLREYLDVYATMAEIRWRLDCTCRMWERIQAALNG